MAEPFEHDLARFTEWMRVRGFSDRTRELYVQYLRFFQTYIQQETSIQTIQEIDMRTLQGYQNHLAFRKSRLGKPLSLITQGCHLCGLRTFFQFLYETGRLLYNPAASLKSPKTPRHLPRGIMHEKDVEHLLSQADTKTPLGFRNRTILEVLYSTAIRNGELCRLTLQDTDLVQSRLVIRETKNRQDRVVPLGEIACEYLREYLIQIRPQLNTASSDILFLSKSGRALRREMIEKIVRDYNKSAGITGHITPHSFRHSCATHMLKRGADIRYIQELLGHRSISSTQIYTHVEPVDLKKVHRQCHPREQFQELDHDPE